MSDIFPFDLVEKGSRIIVYGLGDVGIKYLDQLEELRWCEIVGVYDKNKKIEDFQYKQISYEQFIDGEWYDYVVIAIKAYEVANSIFSDLCNLGVPKKKIISYHIRNKDFIELGGKSRSNDDEKIRIAFHLIGTMGDCIVYTAAYAKIVSLVPEVEIDIYCANRTPEHIFKYKKNVTDIYIGESKKSYKRYDVEIRAAEILTIVGCDYEKIKLRAPELYKLVRETEDSVYAKGLPIRSENRAALIYDRARVLGFDRYQMLGLGNVWNLSSEMAQIELDDNFREQFNQLGLKKYITFNCCAYNFLSKQKKRQTKVWPSEYFERLNTIFSEQYSDYEIIQIGDLHSDKIKGVNRYFLGQNLELVKYILKNSMLHIDCEGGLVHMGTVLKTKCIVLFGPTPMEFYRYRQNINIKSGECHNCAHLGTDWWMECYRGNERAECMYAITPEMVMEKVHEVLEDNKGNIRYLQDV